MTKAIVLTSALLIGSAALGLSGLNALGDEAKSADSVKRAQCERDATLQLYVSEKKKSGFIKQCLASNRQLPTKPVAGRSRVHPTGFTARPAVKPLGGGNPPSISTGGIAPSNAGGAQSAPVVGSSGISTTGSGATSISGSSGSSIGSSAGGM